MCIRDRPAWVDHVYSAERIIEQYDYYGQYHNGFWNSIFGQRDVTVTTDGYNYPVSYTHLGFRSSVAADMQRAAMSISGTNARLAENASPRRFMPTIMPLSLIHI